MIATLELIALTKQYGSSITVLDSLYYTFKQGTSYAITGASGSGKSTLLHLLSLLDAPTSGTISYNGTCTGSFSEKEKAVYLQKTVGIVLQNPHLLADITLKENIMLAGLIAGVPKQVCAQRADELLDLVLLRLWADHLPWQISGGQQQRTALARALFHNPLFILADEPTGNLDEHTGAVIIELLQQYQKNYGTGLIISTHDPRLAQNMDITCTISQGTMSIEHRNDDIPSHTLAPSRIMSDVVHEKA